MECIPKWFPLHTEKLYIIHVRRRPSIVTCCWDDSRVRENLNEEGNKVSQWYDKIFWKVDSQKSNHKLWPKIKEHRIDVKIVVQKPELKLLGVTLNELVKYGLRLMWVKRRFAGKFQVLSAWYTIEITEINTYTSAKLQIVKSAMLSHLAPISLTVNW